MSGWVDVALPEFTLNMALLNTLLPPGKALSKCDQATQMRCSQSTPSSFQGKITDMPISAFPDPERLFKKLLGQVARATIT